MSEYNEPLVSIIIPCYNCALYLEETLNSVHNQTFKDWNCIIIDDGSTDNSRQIALEFIQKDKRYKYSYQTNKGVSAARNSGIRQSTGKYVLPLDGDDKISTKYVEEAVEIMQKDPTIKVVYSRAEFFGGIKNKKWKLKPFSIRNLLIENVIFCSAFYRREDFNKTDGYSEKMVEGFEDWEFWISFIGESDRVFQISKVHFYYRIGHDSRNPLTDVERQKRLRRQIYEQHKELYNKYFSLPDVIYDNYRLDNALKTLYRSNDYIIGNFIMRPYRFFKKLIQ